MNAVVEHKPTSAYERLKRRHQRFVDEYVNGNTATGALRAVGNKSGQARKIAHRLLHDPEVQEAIRERTLIAMHDAGANAVAVVKQMVAVASSDVRKLTNEDGTHKAPHELDEQTALAIKSFDIEEVSTGGREGTRYKYQFWDKNKAAEFLGKAHGLIQNTNVHVDRSKHVTNNNALVVQGGLPNVADWLAGYARAVPETGVAASVQDRPLLPAQVHAEPEGHGE